MREQEIQHLLNQIRSLLERYRVKFWADYFAELEEYFKTAYMSGQSMAKRGAINRLEELYGGMGSFNDLTISRLGGDAISREEGPMATEALDCLREQLYQMIQEEKAALR